MRSWNVSTRGLSRQGREPVRAAMRGQGERGLRSQETTGSAECLQEAGGLIPGKHRWQEPPRHDVTVPMRSWSPGNLVPVLHLAKKRKMAMPFMPCPSSLQPRTLGLACLQVFIHQTARPCSCGYTRAASMNVDILIDPKPCLCGTPIPASGDNQQEACPAVSGIDQAAGEGTQETEG